MLYGVVVSVSLVSMLVIVCLIYLIKKRTNKQGKTKKKSVIKDYSQVYKLEERVYDEIDVTQMTGSVFTKTVKNEGNDNKDGVQPIQTENSDENTVLSHENLHGKNSYEQF